MTLIMKLQESWNEHWLQQHQSGGKDILRSSVRADMKFAMMSLSPETTQQHTLPSPPGCLMGVRLRDW